MADDKPLEKGGQKDTSVAPLLLKSQTRREFLINMIMTVGLLSGLGSLFIRFFQFLYPMVPPLKFIEVLAAKRGDIPLNSARAFNLPQGKVMIANKENKLQAFSAICTHLACIYHWEDDKNRFHCPCHHGMFDIDGKVLSGPPPRPLDRIETVVRGDDVYLKMPVREEVL